MGAGLALTGKNVFVTSPACFLAARAYEQVKVDAAYNNTNVKLMNRASWWAEQTGPIAKS